MTWGEFNREAALHELAVTGGLVSSTGIAGYTLGGGLGWLMGTHGLAADNLISVELVTAEGEVLNITDDSHPVVRDIPAEFCGTTVAQLPRRRRRVRCGASCLWSELRPAGRGEETLRPGQRLPSEPQHRSSRVAQSRPGVRPVGSDP